MKRRKRKDVVRESNPSPESASTTECASCPPSGATYPTERVRISGDLSPMIPMLRNFLVSREPVLVVLLMLLLHDLLALVSARII